jgi:putative transcriptional regulator
MKGKRNLAAEIMAGLEDFQAWRDGHRNLRVSEVELPRAQHVVIIRRKLNLSQDAFAAFINVPVSTVRNWEQGRREPNGPARAFLHVAAKDPNAVLSAFAVKQSTKSHKRSEARPVASNEQRATKTRRERAA